MLGQEKSLYQVEVDAAATLVDFWLSLQPAATKNAVRLRDIDSFVTASVAIRKFVRSAELRSDYLEIIIVVVCREMPLGRCRAKSTSWCGVLLPLHTGATPLE